MRVLHTLCLGLITYYYLAQVCFNPLDHSPFSVSIPSISNNNMTGEIGATISGYLRFYLGLSSYLLAIPFLTVAASGLFHHKKGPGQLGLWQFLAASLCIVSASLLLYLVSPMLDEYKPASQYVGTIGEQIWSRTELLLGKGGLITLTSIGFTTAFILCLRTLKSTESIEDENDTGDKHATIA